MKILWQSGTAQAQLVKAISEKANQNNHKDQGKKWKTYQSAELYGVALFKENQQNKNQSTNQPNKQKSHKTQKSVGECSG